MGAGNPKLKSFDNELFEPTTYFLDLSHECEEDEEPDYDLEQMYYEDFIENLCSELSLQSKEDIYHDQLSYAFREGGIIIAEGKNCYVITETGAEYRHLPIAIIPNFKFDEIREGVEESYDEISDDSIEEESKLLWDSRFIEFKEEGCEIIKKIKEWYGDKLCKRNGAWMSSPTDDEPSL